MHVSKPGSTVKECRSSGWPNGVRQVRSNLDGSVAHQETEEHVVAWMRDWQALVSLLTDISEMDEKNDSPNAAAAASK